MNLIKKQLMVIIVSISILGAMVTNAYLTTTVANHHSNKEQINKRICVVIDAGHGGVDGGAVSCSGVAESHINLKIAHSLNDLLHLLGVRTYMIRTEDISVYTAGKSIAEKKISDLKERVRIINQTNNPILISIHQNYYSDSRYSGAQVFYYSDATLAKQIQDALVMGLNPGSKRKVKKADGVYLLQNISCPAALVECGFISNPSEEKLLNNPIYQRKLSCVIASVVSCYIYNNTIA